MDLETIPWFIKFTTFKFTTSKVNNRVECMQDKNNLHWQHATAAYAHKRGQQ